tara:strand:- start:344 stop:493 length:150 start_codon:yes stop_codon:yes gene_type:complete
MDIYNDGGGIFVKHLFYLRRSGRLTRIWSFLEFNNLNLRGETNTEMPQI